MPQMPVAHVLDVADGALRHARVAPGDDEARALLLEVFLHGRRVPGPLLVGVDALGRSPEVLEGLLEPHRGR